MNIDGHTKHFYFEYMPYIVSHYVSYNVSHNASYSVSQNISHNASHVSNFTVHCVYTHLSWPNYTKHLKFNGNDTMKVDVQKLTSNWLH